MGILRTDRVSGLGGANAITGSTFFGNGNDTAGNYLRIDTGTTDDFAFGTGDFTIEFWFNRPALTTQQHFYDFRGGTNTNTVLLYMSNNAVYYFGNAAERITSGNVPSGEWVHIALVRSSASTKLYFNGTQTGSTYSDSLNLVSPPTGSGFIGSNGGTDGILPSGSYLSGHISNFRVQKGKAEYTADFTPPTHRLEKTPETVLLTCNSSGNVSNEETGKVVSPERDTLNDALPQASRFTPNSPVGFSTTTDVGTQFGSTFDGVTTFDSQAYFVPPGGNTRERNRGRAVIGWANNPVNTAMDVFNIQSSGNTTGFGNLTSGNKWGSHAFSSTTRGLWAGGYINTPASTFFNTIEFVTIANNGNPIDFGDITTASYRSGCCSSSTRGLIALGYVAPAFGKVNTIDQVTMATAGNATNFGDLFQTRSNMASTSSPTRGIFAGGTTPANQGTIDFVTIASAGDAQDFGDLQEAVDSSMALASTTRGIIGGGYPSPANTNVINFITIASAGNAQDFGDLTGLYSVGSAVSNKTRGVFCGGYTAPTKHNLMEFVTISTTGNASDFGDMTYARRDFGACSDSHGGLS